MLETETLGSTLLGSERLPQFSMNPFPREVTDDKRWTSHICRLWSIRTRSNPTANRPVVLKETAWQVRAILRPSSTYALELSSILKRFTMPAPVPTASKLGFSGDQSYVVRGGKSSCLLTFA